MGVPERAALEGQFGTKAEAGVHGDFAITNIEMRHKKIVQIINWHVVNHTLRLNWGEKEENTVWIKAWPLNDVVKRYLASVYDKILTSPEAASQELADIDAEALRDRLGIRHKKIPPVRFHNSVLLVRHAGRREWKAIDTIWWSTVKQ